MRSLADRREDVHGDPLLEGDTVHVVATAERVLVVASVKGENAITVRRADCSETAMRCGELAVHLVEPELGRDRLGQPLATGILVYFAAHHASAHTDGLIQGLDEVRDDVRHVWVSVLGHGDAMTPETTYSVATTDLQTVPDWGAIVRDDVRFFATPRNSHRETPRIHVADRFVRSFYALDAEEQYAMLFAIQRNAAGEVVQMKETGLREACGIGLPKCPFVELEQRELEQFERSLAQAARWRQERAAMDSEVMRDPWGAICRNQDNKMPPFAIADPDPDVCTTRSVRPPNDPVTATYETYAMMKTYCDAFEFGPDERLAEEMASAKAAVDALREEEAAAAAAAHAARRAALSAWLDNSQLKRLLEKHEYDTLSIIDKDFDVRYRTISPIDASLADGELATQLKPTLASRGLLTHYARVCKRAEEAHHIHIRHLESKYELDGRPLRPEERVELQRVSRLRLVEEGWRLVSLVESFADDDHVLRDAIETPHSRTETMGRLSAHWEFNNDIRRLIRTSESVDALQLLLAQPLGTVAHALAAELLPVQHPGFSFARKRHDSRRNWTSCSDDDVTDPSDSLSLRKKPDIVRGAEAIKWDSYHKLHFNFLRTRDEMLEPEHLKHPRGFWWCLSEGWLNFKTFLAAYDGVFFSTDVPSGFAIRGVFRRDRDDDSWAVNCEADINMHDFDFLQSFTDAEDKASNWNHGRHTQNEFRMKPNDLVVQEQNAMTKWQDDTMYRLGERVQELRGARDHMKPSQIAWLNRFSDWRWATDDDGYLSE